MSIRQRPTAPASFSLARLPRIRFGAGAIDGLAELVGREGTRVFLVTGQRSLSQARLDRLATDLAELHVTLVGHVRTGSEPGPATIDAMVAQARNVDADVVVGIGGGSVLDTAKAVAGLVRTGTSVMDHLEGVGRGVPYVGPAVPFVAVPTTAGTGSEATRNAVITERGAAGFKRSFRDDRLIATDAIVDPDLLAGCEPELIAANGLDALTQLIEAYTSQRANPMTDAWALDGLAAVRDGLLTWHRDPSGAGAAGARSRMAYAALLSGICLANAGLGAVHGLAAPIGSMLPIAHGAACGALLVAVTDTNIARLTDLGPSGVEGLARYARIGRILGDLPSAIDDAAASSALVGCLRDWAATLGVPRLSNLGLRTDDLAHVIEGISTSSMATNPVSLHRDDLAAIIASSL